MTPYHFCYVHVLKSVQYAKVYIGYTGDLRSTKVVRGFTLVETLIYLAIYAIIMAGVLVSTYAVFSSSARNQTKAMVQEEGSFLVGKIDWSLTGIKTVSDPNDGDSGTTDEGNILTLVKYDTSAGDPTVALSGTDLTITRGGNPLEILNTSNVQVACPPAGCFTHISASGDGINPESVSASFTLTARSSDGILYSQSFYTKKYLRK